jgi:hypothetical protein
VLHRHRCDSALLYPIYHRPATAAGEFVLATRLAFVYHSDHEGATYLLLALAH